MSLLVVAYPSLSAQDAAWLQAIRQKYGELEHSALPPHFTFVFPLSTVEEDSLRAHVKVQAMSYGRIEFTLRSSLLVKDDSMERYHVVLVPDEGLSRIVKLHDKLYTGVLAASLRLDIAFIPHITIGYSGNAPACKAIVDSINSEAFEVQGAIHTLSIVQKTENEIRTIAQIELG